MICHHLNHKRVTTTSFVFDLSTLLSSFVPMTIDVGSTAISGMVLFLATSPKSLVTISQPLGYRSLDLYSRCSRIFEVLLADFVE
ncbi:hypothetical protein RO3G_04461 [Rhizopus delemar RA 99-880]|uniref:Uncharacterized protein n=1 Tax=Rhizopus delemar (strain RA 99-880 / ATCC MYA-4621 / FGSC 9543 / NRRL 43880) TaxID=246409 RepID=I1BU76_RHIO9|nr:hypothetical protein RO3G_04461 [Rhizopus delemar RA 99-880]|eukprot:EIE79756.1 hypothetical protein RO3G_04461 [Rhizopus delemar RA 99-880]